MSCSCVASVVLHVFLPTVHSTYLYCVYSNSRSSYIEVVQEDALRRCTRVRAAHKRQTVDVFASFLDTTIDERLLTLVQLCEQQNIVVEQLFFTFNTI